MSVRVSVCVMRVSMFVCVSVCLSVFVSLCLLVYAWSVCVYACVRM